MNIHEYQAKQLLGKFGVTVPRGKVAFTVDEAVHAAKELGGPIWVVKAQIHAGGRGKGGGVKIADSMKKVEQISAEILGMQLVTRRPVLRARRLSACILKKAAISPVRCILVF